MPRLRFPWLTLLVLSGLALPVPATPRMRRMAH